MLANVTKGRPYSFTLADKATVFTGTAASSARAGSVGLHDATGAGYKVPLARLRDATPAEAAALAAAVQAKMAALPQVAKGDVVEFTDEKGAVHRGVVRANRGARCTVDEGVHRWTLGTKNLRPVVVEAGAAGDLDGYAVSSYKSAEWNSEETTCFEARITLRGVPVAVVHNEGHGGPTMVDPVRGAPDAARRFEQLCDAAAHAAGVKNTYSENAQGFVDWFREERPLGKSLHDHFAEDAAQFAAWDKETDERIAARKAAEAQNQPEKV